MRPLSVVVLSPTLDDDLGPPEREEDLPVQQFISEPGNEALDIAILLGAAWLDEGRLCAGQSIPTKKYDLTKMNWGEEQTLNICKN